MFEIEEVKNTFKMDLNQGDYEKVKRIVKGEGPAPPPEDEKVNLERDRKGEELAYPWLYKNEKLVQLKNEFGTLNLVHPLTLRSPIIKKNQVPLNINDLYPMYLREHEVQFVDEEEYIRLTFNKKAREAKKRKGVLGKKMYNECLNSSSKSEMKPPAPANRSQERMVAFHRVNRMLEEYDHEGRFMERSSDDAMKLLQELTKSKSPIEEWKRNYSMDFDVVESERAKRKKLFSKEQKSFVKDCNNISVLLFGHKKLPSKESRTFTHSDSTGGEVGSAKTIMKESRNLLPLIQKRLKKLTKGPQLHSQANESVGTNNNMSSLFQAEDVALNTGNANSHSISKDYNNSSIFNYPRHSYNQASHSGSKAPENSIPEPSNMKQPESTIPLTSVSFADTTPIPALDTDQMIINDVRRHYFENILSGQPDLNEVYNRPFMINMQNDKPIVYVKLPEYTEKKYKVKHQTAVAAKIYSKFEELEEKLEKENAKSKTSILRGKGSKEKFSLFKSKIGSRIISKSKIDEPSEAEKGSSLSRNKKVEFSEELSKESKNTKNKIAENESENTIRSFEQSGNSKNGKSSDNAEHSKILPMLEEAIKKRQIFATKNGSIWKNEENLTRVKKNLEKLANLKAISVREREKKNYMLSIAIQSYRRDKAYFNHSQQSMLKEISFSKSYEKARSNARSQSENSRAHQYESEERKQSRNLYSKMVEIYKKYNGNIELENKQLFEHILNYHHLILFEGGSLKLEDYHNSIDFINNWPTLANFSEVEKLILEKITRIYGYLISFEVVNERRIVYGKQTSLNK